VRREVVVPTIAGAATIVAVFAAGGDWIDALIGLGCAVVVTSLLIPGSELAWN
jgi:hypothetical protein